MDKEREKGRQELHERRQVRQAAMHMQPALRQGSA